MTTTYIRRALVGALALSLLAPTFALAATTVDAALGASAQTNVAGTSAGASVTISAAVMTRAKTKADTEIDRRITALNALSTRVNAMTKITADIKTSITTNIQNQITLLSTLKAKIDADTDGATLKTDVQSITQAYRVYALILPQARITAAADREATILNMLAELGGKLQTRIQAAAAAGADVTALNAALTDMGTKVADAQTNVQASVTGIVTLTPDNGDQTKMAANTAALKTARGQIQTAQQDFVAARKDIDTITKGLRSLKISATASTSVQTQ